MALPEAIFMNPYDVVEPDELRKLRRHLDAWQTKGAMRTIDIRTHDSMRAISVRGHLDEVLSLHEGAAKHMGLRTMGSRREVEVEGDLELIYGTVWYELEQRSLSLPDDFNLMKEVG
jgi:hypothetical protein